jgi:shikimate kinase
VTGEKKDRVFLVGFMGSGKSTLGKKIARALGYDFIDLDIYIEQKEQKTINEIFTTSGEDYFRKLEHDCLMSLEAEHHIVIATGGGTPLNGELMSWMLERGCCIYIRMSEAALYSRLKNAAPKRPLLADKNEEELRSYIHEKIEERERVYARSHIIIDGLQTSVTALAGLLKRKLMPNNSV